MAPLLKLKLDKETIKRMDVHRGNMKYSDFVRVALEEYLRDKEVGRGKGGRAGGEDKGEENTHEIVTLEEDIRAMKAVLDRLDARMTNMESMVERLYSRSDLGTDMAEASGEKILRFSDEERVEDGIIAGAGAGVDASPQDTGGWEYVGDEGEVDDEGGEEGDYEDEDYDEDYEYDDEDVGGYRYDYYYDEAYRRDTAPGGGYWSQDDRRTYGSYSYRSVPSPEPPPPPPPPPPSTPPQSAECPFCGNDLSYVEEYGRYYCYHCERYINNPAFKKQGVDGGVKRNFLDRILYGP